MPARAIPTGKASTLSPLATDPRRDPPGRPLQPPEGPAPHGSGSGGQSAQTEQGGAFSLLDSSYYKS